MYFYFGVFRVARRSSFRNPEQQKQQNLKYQQEGHHRGQPKISPFFSPTFIIYFNNVFFYCERVSVPCVAFQEGGQVHVPAILRRRGVHRHEGPRRWLATGGVAPETFDARRSNNSCAQRVVQGENDDPRELGGGGLFSQHPLSQPTHSPSSPLKIFLRGVFFFAPQALIFFSTSGLDPPINRPKKSTFFMDGYLYVKLGGRGTPHFPFFSLIPL